MILETKRHNCPICNISLDNAMVIWDKRETTTSSDRIILSGGKMIHGVSVICDCGLVQELDPMTPESLEYFYRNVDGSSMYRDIYPCSTGQAMQHTVNAINFFMNYIVNYTINELKETPRFPIVRNVLVVGSGISTEDFLPVFNQILGPTVDVKTYDTGLAKSLTNYIEPPQQDFDLVICTNVLEHVYNPLEFLNMFHMWCNLKTKIVLSMPDLLGTAITQPRNSWFSNAHIYHFTFNAIFNLIGLLGFDCKEWNGGIIENFGNKLYFLLDIMEKPAIPCQEKVPAVSTNYKKMVREFVLNSDKIYSEKEKILDEFKKSIGKYTCGEHSRRD